MGKCAAQTVFWTPHGGWAHELPPCSCGFLTKTCTDWACQHSITERGGAYIVRDYGSDCWRKRESFSSVEQLLEVPVLK